MRAESAWQAALLLKPIGDHFYGPLQADEIRTRLLALGPAQALEGRNGVLIPLQPLRDLLAGGDDLLTCPYPPPDEERGGWIWSGFSDEQLLSRTRAVYRAALVIYEGFVANFFPALGPSLRNAPSPACPTSWNPGSWSGRRIAISSGTYLHRRSATPRPRNRRRVGARERRKSNRFVLEQRGTPSERRAHRSPPTRWSALARRLRALDRPQRLRGRSGHPPR
jgi:hypothetical protein